MDDEGDGGEGDTSGAAAAAAVEGRRGGATATGRVPAETLVGGIVTEPMAVGFQDDVAGADAAGDAAAPADVAWNGGANAAMAAFLNVTGGGGGGVGVGAGGGQGGSPGPTAPQGSVKGWELEAMPMYPSGCLQLWPAPAGRSFHTIMHRFFGAMVGYLVAWLLGWFCHTYFVLLFVVFCSWVWVSVVHIIQ